MLTAPKNLAVAALASMFWIGAAASADQILLYTTGFDAGEGYPLGTGDGALRTPTLKGQQGWVGTTYANSWVSDDTSAGSGAGRELRFTGTGYARMVQIGSNAHALDASEIPPAAEVESITIQFDLARLIENTTSGAARPIEFKIGDLVFLRGVFRDSPGSLAKSELRTPDDTAWSGGWTGSAIKAGGSWVWQDRLRARFTITITADKITGGFTVLDADLINKFPNQPAWLTDDSFTYELTDPVDLDTLAASDISFYTSLSGTYTHYMIDELSVTASMAAMPEPSSIGVSDVSRDEQGVDLQ